eukprot:GFYU01003728.1.p1 GENE.GFYU01003728.1~~GFYU01003728.1.p1  ORF type:complete len:282 (-),score=53.84 GFYU01003728.1:169-975(-)
MMWSTQFLSRCSHLVGRSVLPAAAAWAPTTQSLAMPSVAAVTMRAYSDAALKSEEMEKLNWLRNATTGQIGHKIEKAFGSGGKPRLSYVNALFMNAKDQDDTDFALRILARSRQKMIPFTKETSTVVTKALLRVGDLEGAQEAYFSPTNGLPHSPTSGTLIMNALRATGDVERMLSFHNRARVHVPKSAHSGDMAFLLLRELAASGPDVAQCEEIAAFYRESHGKAVNKGMKYVQEAAAKMPVEEVASEESGSDDAAPADGEENKEEK